MLLYIISVGLLVTALGFVLHRMAGGGHPFTFIGTHGARALFIALPLSIMVIGLSYFGLITAPIWLPGAVFIASMLGRAIVPHSAGMNLDVPMKGRAPDDFPTVAFPERLGYLLSAATVRYWYISLALFTLSPLAILLPLLAVGYPLCYLVGLWLEKRGWVFKKWITFHCEWAEFLFGGWLFGTLYAALLLLGG